MGEIPIIHTYLYNKIVLSFFNIIIQVLKFWKFYHFEILWNFWFFFFFGKFWNLTFFCILPRVPGYCASLRSQIPPVIPTIGFRLRHFRCKEFYPLVLWIWNQNIAISTIVGTSSHNMRQAQPVWRTKSYNFKREAWEGNVFFFFQILFKVFF
jgi:hypothetical protein